MKDQWFEASAPGRLDVMGGIADYSGSLVLQMPIRESTRVRMKLRNDFQCNVASDVDGKILHAQIKYSDILKDGTVNYEFAREFLNRNSETSWVGYVVGCALVLQSEKGINFAGADFEIESSVPLGKGVSSSASVEVAVMKALQKAFAIEFSDTELPRLAQKVENLIVGAPCGLMDQLTSYFGEENKLLPIVCQPDKLLPLIEIPEGINFIGVDSGVRHSVGGSSYTDVRCAAFMGYSIIAKELGVLSDSIIHAREKNDRSLLPFNGYLCNIPKEKFDQDFLHTLPETLSGRDFLETYGSTIDSVTTVNPETIYSVRACASHPVYENDRVNQFLQILQGWKVSDQIDRLEKLGAIMHQSHESYSRCGLGSPRTDELVEIFKNSRFVFGSKITGGGSGGTVCALAFGSEGIEEVKNVHQQFQKKYNTALTLFK
jgi:galactokinase